MGCTTQENEGRGLQERGLRREQSRTSCRVYAELQPVRNAPSSSSATSQAPISPAAFIDPSLCLESYFPESPLAAATLSASLIGTGSNAFSILPSGNSKMRTLPS